MRWLGFILGCIGVATLWPTSKGYDAADVFRGVVVCLGALVALRTVRRSAFFTVLVALFGIEALAVSAVMLAGRKGVLPAALAPNATFGAAATTLVMFMLIFHLLEWLPVVGRALAIADRYLRTDRRLSARLGKTRIEMSERRFARAFIVISLLLGQAAVFGDIQFTLAFGRISDAMQKHQPGVFWVALLIAGPLWMALKIGAYSLQALANRVLTVRWRNDLSDDYERRWIATGAHYRMALDGIGGDNPDQRIQEDVYKFISGGEGGGNSMIVAPTGFGVFSFTITLVAQTTSFLSYAIILWRLSAHVNPFAPAFSIPGFLFWLVVGWSGLQTAATILVGRSLVPLSFRRQHVEADYRYGLARLREYGEQIALMAGGRTEVAMLRQRFTAVARNAYGVAIFTTVVEAFTAFMFSLSSRVPYIVLGALFFAGAVTLGDLAQTASAFLETGFTLGFFAASFPALAELKSVMDRLTTFDAALDRAGRMSAGQVKLDEHAAIRLEDVAIDLPDGTRLTEGLSLQMQADEDVLLTGPSGTGKSTLFRVIAGIWPHWSGTLSKPVGASILVLPQKPYLPAGSLEAIVSYPAPGGAFERATVLRALDDVGLGHLQPEIDAEENWSQRLSGGEQQRLAIARALLICPTWLLLDEATSALDTGLETRMYEMIKRRLPGTTILSIGHRESLIAHHARRLDMAPTTIDGRRSFAIA